MRNRTPEVYLTNGSPFYYFTLDGKRRSTRERSKPAAERAAREMEAEFYASMERTFSNARIPTGEAYPIGQALVDLHNDLVEHHKKKATIDYVKKKGSQLLTFFKPELDINDLSPKSIRSYVAYRREQEAVRGFRSSKISADKLEKAKRLLKEGESMRTVARILCVPRPQLKHALQPRPIKFISDDTIGKELTVLMQSIYLAQSRTEGPRFYGNPQELKLRKGFLTKSDPKERFLTREEFLKLWRHIPEQHRDMFLCFVHTGCRYGEIHRITASNIDHDSRQLWIIGHKGSDKYRTRWVPLHEDCYEMLKRRAKRTPNGPLFPHAPSCAELHNVKRLCSCAGLWRKTLVRACANASIPNVSSNDLRRTFCTWLATAGCPILDCKKFMGHSPDSPMVERVYAKLEVSAGRGPVQSFASVKDAPIAPSSMDADSPRMMGVAVTWKQLTKELLQELVNEKPIVQVAEQFRITDGAVIKRCKVLGVKTPGRGYWQRKAAKV